MKRGPGHHYEGGGGNQGGGGMPHKRAREDKFECRILVPSKVAGSLIGKGGANIQKLRSENNANIRIPDCPGPERIMAIMANDAESAVSVLKQCLPSMTDDATRGGTPTSDSNVEVRLLIHQSIVGGIIGRAGFKIKEIRESSGASIKVYQNQAPQSTDRCISIQGTVDKIALAITEIFDVVGSTDVKGVDEPYDPINFDAYYANEYGGFGSEMELGFGGPSAGGRGPSGGRGSRPVRGGRGARMESFGNRFDTDDGYMSFRDGFAGGPRPGGRFGRGGGRNNFDGRGYGGGNDQVGSFERDQRFAGGFGGRTDNSNSRSESVQVTIPKDMAGAIIGPGGSRIRKIRNDSKANITIDEPGAGSNERIITIAGTKDQIQTAQYLLQQSVRENAPHLAGGAGHGGYGSGY